MLVIEPHQFKANSKEKGAAWKTVAENLQAVGMKITSRSLMERLKLVRGLKRKEAMENRASGVEVEFPETDKAITGMLERMSEFEMATATQKQKQLNDRAVAEEMGRRATEKFGETRRGHNEGHDSVDDDDQHDVAFPERLRRNNKPKMLDVLKESLNLKKKEQERGQELRGRETGPFQRNYASQQKYQRNMMQHFQQQQRALTMAIVNTLAEIVKTLKSKFFGPKLLLHLWCDTVKYLNVVVDNKQYILMCSHSNLHVLQRF